MKNKILVLAFFCLLGEVPLKAEPVQSSDYDYQVQSANFSDKTKFYFFRFNRANGDIEVFSYNEKNSDSVSWHKVGEGRDAYVYIINPK